MSIIPFCPWTLLRGVMSMVVPVFHKHSPEEWSLQWCALPIKISLRAMMSIMVPFAHKHPSRSDVYDCPVFHKHFPEEWSLYELWFHHCGGHDALCVMWWSNGTAAALRFSIGDSRSVPTPLRRVLAAGRQWRNWKRPCSMKSTEIQGNDWQSLLLSKMSSETSGDLNHLNCHAQAQDRSHLFQVIPHDTEVLTGRRNVGIISVVWQVIELAQHLSCSWVFTMSFQKRQEQGLKVDGRIVNGNGHDGVTGWERYWDEKKMYRGEVKCSTCRSWTCH